MMIYRLFFAFCSIASVIARSNALFSSTCHSFVCEKNRVTSETKFCTGDDNCIYPGEKSSLNSSCFVNQNTIVAFYLDGGQGTSSCQSGKKGCRYTSVPLVPNGDNHAEINITLLDETPINSQFNFSESNSTIFFLYTNTKGTEIKWFNSTLSIGPETHNLTFANVADFTPMAVSGGYVYYATSSQLAAQNYTIYKFPIAPNSSDIIVQTNIDKPVTSIAVDYVTNNTYFAAGGTLHICADNRGKCTSYKPERCDVGVVALAPRFGWLFYSCVEKNKSSNSSTCIMRSSMDGSNETTLVCDLKTNPVSAIVVNELENFFIYTGRDDKVARFSLDGKFKEAEILPERSYLSVAVTDNMTFYLESNLKNSAILCRVDSRGIEECINLPNFLPQDNPIQWNNFYVYDSSSNQRNRPIENPCKELCLLRPSSSGAKAGLNCSCSFNHTHLFSTPDPGNSYPENHTLSPDRNSTENNTPKSNPGNTNRNPENCTLSPDCDSTKNNTSKPDSGNGHPESGPLSPDHNSTENNTGTSNPDPSHTENVSTLQDPDQTGTSPFVVFFIVSIIIVAIACIVNRYMPNAFNNVLGSSRRRRYTEYDNQSFSLLQEEY